MSDRQPEEITSNPAANDAETAASITVEIPQAIQASPHRLASLRLLAWAGGGLMLGVLATLAVWRFSLRSAEPLLLVRFAVNLPGTYSLALSPHPMAFSADGRRLAYIAQAEKHTRIYIQSMDQVEPQPLPGAVNARCPFYSPDGSWIGYFDSGDSKLKKIPLSGGAPQALCDAPICYGASWGLDGFILFSSDVFSGLWRVRAEGGKPEPVTQLLEKESSHRWPEILPDGKTVIFTVCPAGAGGKMSLAAFSPETRSRKILLEDASDARYSPTGHLLFVRGSDLMAVRFAPESLEVQGQPYLIKQGIETDQAFGAGHYAFAKAGLLAYAYGSEDTGMRSLAWADRQGGIERLTVNRGAFSYPRLSPDGRLMAVVIQSQAQRSDIWILEVENGSFTRLTSDGNNSQPVWTPDGKRITFASDREGQWNLFWMPVDGSSPAEKIQQSADPQLPNAWSPDGRFLVYTDFAPKTGPDIWILAATDEGKAQPLLQTAHAEWGGPFSPDGRWLAYVSDESGPNQVYVQPYPGPGTRIQVSTAEGREPVWGRDGRELFFRYWKGLMVSTIQNEPEFDAESPSLLVSGAYETAAISAFPNYDVSLDGQRFVMIPRERKETRQIYIDMNCLGEIGDRHLFSPLESRQPPGRAARER